MSLAARAVYHHNDVDSPAAAYIIGVYIKNEVRQYIDYVDFGDVGPIVPWFAMWWCCGGRLKNNTKRDFEIPGKIGGDSPTYFSWYWLVFLGIFTGCNIECYMSPKNSPIQGKIQGKIQAEL